MAGEEKTPGAGTATEQVRDDKDLQRAIREYQADKDKAYTELASVRQELATLHEELETAKAQTRASQVDQLGEDEMKVRLKDAEVMIAKLSAKEKVATKSLKEHQAANQQWGIRFAVYEVMDEAGVSDADTAALHQELSAARDERELTTIKKRLIAELKTSAQSQKTPGRFDQGRSAALPGTLSELEKFKGMDFSNPEVRKEWEAKKSELRAKALAEKK